MIEWTEGRVHQKAQPGLTILVVRLHELVLGGAAAEVGRQHLFQHPDDVKIEERHATGRQLLEAADAVEVLRPTNRNYSLALCAAQQL